MIIEQPGRYSLTREQYDMDVCPTPSLSSSVAKILLAQTPAHARLAHPRLNPHFEREDPTRFDMGKIAHALLLDDRGTRVEIIEADDWKTKAAKAARAAAIAAGKLPILKHQTIEAKRMVRAARAQLAKHEACDAFTDGLPEQTLIWQEPNGIWCRARLDWLPSKWRGERVIIPDYKTTKASAHPDAWVRTMYGMDGDIQAAFYIRAVRMALGVEARFRFVVQETAPPYALSVIELDPASIAMAMRKVETAIAAWRYALNSETWHGYPNRVCYVTAPAYEEARWTERELREQASPDEYRIAMEMQAP